MARRDVVGRATAYWDDVLNDQGNGLNLNKYTQVDIVYELIPHNDLLIDLKRILATDPQVVYRTRELIEELRSNQDLLDRLSQQNYGVWPNKPKRDAFFNVKMWAEAQKNGLNLWRLRDLSLVEKGLEYRLVYAFLPQKKQYFVLAIVEKDFDYDTDHPVSRRIFASYRSLEEFYW